MATESKTPPPSLLGTGAAAKAAAAIRSRRDKLDEAEKKDTGYKAGGSVKASPKYEASRLYTGPSGAQQYRGSAVSRSRRGEGTRDITVFEPGPGADRQASDYASELQRETRGYKAGGSVKAPSASAIKAYSREYDTQSPAGRNVHESRGTRRGFGKARGA